VDRVWNYPSHRYAFIHSLIRGSGVIVSKK
jgi:hypothetical protein